MWNNLSVTSRKYVRVFLSELNISPVTGRNSPWYEEFPNYAPFEGSETRYTPSSTQKHNIGLFYHQRTFHRKY